MTSSGLYWSPVDALAAINPSGLVANANNSTVGLNIKPLRAMQVLGARFYWKGTNTTIRLRLYRRSDNASLGSVDVATTGAGAYEGRFASPISLPLSTIYNSATSMYTITMWDTRGGAGAQITEIFGPTAAAALWIAPYTSGLHWLVAPYMIMDLGNARIVAGDAAPNADTAKSIPIEPIISL